ncbi:hypothetical protein HMPREF9477_00839 [Lachnospiraceae bacterium 2_1_46FAA]|nr:hypothetical protein HMPREF9477_00839 [Lachnospiraceae bacterium 2_1_46FAA]
MPKFQIITGQKSIEKYESDYRWEYTRILAKLSGADFTEPITAGIFVSIVAWASYQRLEEEGHTVIQKGRKNIRYYVKDYENSLFDLK